MPERQREWLSEEPRGASTRSRPRSIGRCVLFEPLASGGMATVHLGRMFGSAGFARIVAIKRLHAHLAEDPKFVGMFLDEVRLAARLVHPNVVSTLDVVADEQELLLVMEYIHGASLSYLANHAREQGRRIPPGVASAIVAGVLHGLHAAHSAADDQGHPLRIVHRDVSPPNVLVGADGLARVLDFGIAKAVSNLETTRDGELKGKVSYMAPEQIRREPVDPRCDVYSTAVVLWELLAGRRLFEGENDVSLMHQVLVSLVPPPSKYAPNLSQEVDDLVLKGVDADPNKRFSTAREMALALEKAIPPALPSEVGAWVESTASQLLAARKALVTNIEKASAQEEGRVVVGGTANRPVVAVAREDPSVPGASSMPTQRAEPKRLRVIALGGAAVAGALAAVGLFVTSTPAARAPTVASSATAPSVELVRDTAATASSTPESASAPSSSASQRATAPPVRPSRPASPTRTARPSQKCEAQTIDEKGHIVFHPECIKPND